MTNAPVKVNKKAMLKAERKQKRAEIESVDVKQLPKVRIVSSVFTTDKTAERNIPYGMIFMICLFTVAALFVTFLSVRVNEVNNEISGLNTQLAEIREQTAEAKAKVSEKKDLTAIRQAAEELGMVKGDKLPAHHIAVHIEDSVTVYETEEKEERGFSALLSALSNSVTSFIEYMK